MLSKMVQYAKVFITAAPTYLALAVLVITVASEELIPLLPDNVAAVVAGVTATAIAILLAVGRVIRRVTPVPKEERGILPPPPPPPA